MMAPLRPLRRIAIAAAWLLATYLAPGAAWAQPASPPDAPGCAAGLIEPARFRVGNAAGPLGASSAIADFNRDGRPDIAIADRTGQTGASHRFRLQVALAGLDSVSLEIDSTESALALSVADVDHDQDLDIVLSRPLSGEPIGVWLNDGTGRFTAAPAAKFHVPVRSAVGIGERAADHARERAGLSSRAVHGVVRRAVGDALDDGHALPASAHVVCQAPCGTASRPRSPPAPSSLLS